MEMKRTWTRTAPAASPKRMQVPLSVQSTLRESASAPITSTFLKPPPKRQVQCVKNHTHEEQNTLQDTL